MTRIRFIKKKAKKIEGDSFKEITLTVSNVNNTANIPALVTIDESHDKEIVEFSYTGSTESSITTQLSDGVDVSTGANSGRIIRVQGKSVCMMAKALNGKTIGSTTRAIRNYELGKEIINELDKSEK